MSTRRGAATARPPRRAVNRSRARHIVKGEQRGRVRFGVLFLALTATVITVVVVMFETLAWLVGG